MDAIERKAREEFYRKVDEHNAQAAIRRERWAHWIAILLYLLFLAGVNLKIAAQMYYPQYLSPYNVQINNGFSTITVAFVIWLALRYGEIIGLSGNERLGDLPSGYLFFCAFLIGIGGVTFVPSMFTFGIGSTVILFVAAVYFVLHTGRESDRKSLSMAIKKAKEEAKPKPSQTAQTIKVCEVCHKQSLYDVCLDCEQKYKPERHRIRSQNWRAKQHGVEASLTLAQWIETLDAFHWHCAYCQTGRYEVMEHYIPVTLGGGTEQGNCVPACFSCNSKKADKHPELDIHASKKLFVNTNKQKQH